MSWKHELQLRDLSKDARFEVTCTKCGHTRYEEVSHMSQSWWMRQLCLDQIEDRMFCTLRDCRSKCRIMLASDAETEGFQGGLA